MIIQNEIRDYIDSLPITTRTDMDRLHSRIFKILPRCRLRFIDKKVKNGRVVANPVIGYGYAGLGNHKRVAMDSYQIGISASSSGICVCIFGLPEKSYLLDRYGASIGKAKVTGH
ncbi:MAG: DUF1801 domain-containing protein, partial [Flavobacterium sp.]